MIKKTVQLGNVAIRKLSTEIKGFWSAGTKKIVKDLVDSMRKANLVGMAAPQIGVNKRIFVTEIRKTKYRKKAILDGLRIFINPRIESKSAGTHYAYEGCGSVAESGLFAKVRRHKSLRVTAYDLDAQKFSLKATGLLAQIIQHELDHLDGKVFLDRDFDPQSLKSRSEYLKYCDAKLARGK